MRFEDSATVSRPSYWIKPSRRGTIPMIDFSVVVLPAPLRPSSVTTSPGSTSNATPCNTCDSPYHAFSPLTASSGPAEPLYVCGSSFPGASSMPRSEIGFDDGRILRHRCVVALREHFAARQHRDVIGQRRHDRQIMLDHQHGSVRRDALDER